MRRWWLDEHAHAGPEPLDVGYVAGYDRTAGFDPTEDVEVLRRDSMGPESLVVDLGAGTGTFAVSVAALCRRVVAVDVSTAMTAAPRRRIERLGLDNVTVVDAGFLSGRGSRSNGSPRSSDILARAFRRSACGAYTCRRRGS